MKTLILTLIATTLAVANLQAHCGTCSTSEGAHEHHASCASHQLDPYFAAQAALASDDLAAAKNAAKSMLKTGEEKGCSLEEGACCATELTAATQITEASDIKAARKAFKSWSDTLIAKLDEEGLAEGSAIKMYCPMAFNNMGGAWLQSSKDLRNPYYGSMMLTCGMPQKEYGKGGTQQHSGEHHHH
ncbi:DUF3347 domain-containing protein [Pelagicoccus sp. NFK12]|uniref:DUF3347 domain-containing protein n=1 Tax=Pelagicoccus enzymogenes TaxID=2773457 RepID=A0A927IIC2_9BACT|nr:DUF3347 domain-containing protein [Pelagicoccus enzymogenes]MBD5780613.1 DUF3347 domain-containing protein [Pelagicoccus enzymogenes]